MQKISVHLPFKNIMCTAQNYQHCIGEGSCAGAQGPGSLLPRGLRGRQRAHHQPARGSGGKKSIIQTTKEVKKN